MPRQISNTQKLNGAKVIHSHPDSEEFYGTVLALTTLEHFLNIE